MGATFCQRCGLPTQHAYFAPPHRAAPGLVWERYGTPFVFGAAHAWLTDVVHLEFHRACWELSGATAVRSPGTHAWAIVEAYHQEQFDVHGLDDDGRTWMLEEPKPGTRSRARIEAMVTLENDRDWFGRTQRDDYGRIGVIRGIKKVDKTGYATLVRVTRFYEEPKLPGPEETAELEAFEVALKAAVEHDAQAMLVLVLLGHGRAEFLTWARDGAKTKALIEAVPGASAASIDVRDDPNWQEAVREIQSRSS